MFTLLYFNENHYRRRGFPVSRALMHVDIRLAYITTKPRFENANCKFHREQLDFQSGKNENSQVKTTRRGQRFEEISCKRALVVNVTMHNTC